MKKYLAATMPVIGSIASAQNLTGQHIGYFNHWHSDDGASYTRQRIGNFYYWSGYDQYGQYHSGLGNGSATSHIGTTDNPRLMPNESIINQIRKLQRENKKFSLELSSGRIVQVYDP